MYCHYKQHRFDTELGSTIVLMEAVVCRIIHHLDLRLRPVQGGVFWFQERSVLLCRLAPFFYL